MNDFRIGAVLSDSFSVMRRNIPAFLIIIILLQLIPGLAAFNLLPVSDKEFTSPFTSVSYYLRILINLLILAAGMTGVTLASDQALRTRKVALAQVLAESLRHTPIVFVIMVLSFVAIYAGIILLIVPGLILAVFWLFVIPAVVLEAGNPFACFGRSIQIGKGYRWQVFGLLLIMFVLILVVSLVAWLSVYGLTFNPAVMRARALAATSSITVSTFVSQFLSHVALAVTTIVTAVAYLHLKRAKDGDARIADVFS
jgi:hypothetical protein